MIVRTAISFVLRIALYMPLAALAYLCDGLQQLFGRLSDGLFDMASATRQITQAPYVRRYDRLIEEASEENRLALLRKLRRTVE